MTAGARSEDTIMRFGTRTALICAALTWAAPVGAQRTPVVALQPPNASLDEEFTAITSVRELADGRILVTDPRENRLVVADFRTGSVEQIGRTGQGPNEYRTAAPLYPLRGDSSLMPDLLSRRWLVLDGARIVVTMPPQDPIIVATGGFFRGVDARWNFITPRSGPPRPGVTETGKGDSTELVYFSRTPPRQDTIARLREAPSTREIQLDAKGEVKSASVRRKPLTVGEEVAMFPDGWIAIARLDPFRVDWRAPDGRWTRGAPLPVPVIRMSQREKEASIARTKASDPKAQSPGEQYGWPDVMPPYTLGRALISASDGRLLIQRQFSADFPDTRYFIVNRRGGLDAELRMPTSERIIGFGRSSAYVVVTDDDGIQRLRRHPWPATRPANP